VESAKRSAKELLRSHVVEPSAAGGVESGASPELGGAGAVLTSVL